MEKLEGEDIRKVAAGQFHSLALNLHRTKAWAWGKGSAGQLGIQKENLQCKNVPTRIAFPKPVILTDIAAGEETSFAITNEGELYSWGSNLQNTLGYEEDKIPESKTPLRVDMTKVSAMGIVERVSAGASHTLALVRS